MKLTKIQYKKLKELIPLERKPAKISNYKFMCAIVQCFNNREIVANGWHYQKNM